MAKYYEFIKELKSHDPRVDFETQLELIRQRSTPPAPKFRLVLAGTLAVLLVAAGIYLNLARAGGSDSLMAYVFEQEKLNDSPLISYVFDY